MNLETMQAEVRRLISQHVVEIKAATAMGLTDINLVSETFIRDLFRQVFGWTHLRNLNTEEKRNFPAVDLADDMSSIAVQVTSTTTLDKIKESVGTFVQHRLYTRYRRLVVYMLVEKQRSYSQNALRHLLLDGFEFDVEADVIDYRDLLERMTTLDYVGIAKVHDLCRQHIGMAAGVPTAASVRPPQLHIEATTLNLIEVMFPQTLYLADVILPENLPEHGKKGRRRKNVREKIIASLHDMGSRSPSDWEAYAGRLITFRDLTDSSLPLSRIVDRGTITDISPKSYYEGDEGQLRNFKSLLRRCLQQQLYRRGVQWQNKEAIFIFVEQNGKEKREEPWVGKVQSSRIVFERTMKNNKPDEILNCKHLAFHVGFHQFDNKWYLSVAPDWFFSFDGYRRSYYADKNLSWLKRNENNQLVFDQFRFLEYFLKNEAQHPLDIDDDKPRNDVGPIRFGNVTTFGNHPLLEDAKWRPAKQRDEDGQEGLFR